MGTIAHATNRTKNAAAAAAAAAAHLIEGELERRVLDRNSENGRIGQGENQEGRRRL
jgi:hypothetical protein